MNNVTAQVMRIRVNKFVNHSRYEVACISYHKSLQYFRNESREFAGKQLSFTFDTTATYVMIFKIPYPRTVRLLENVIQCLIIIDHYKLQCLQLFLLKVASTARPFCKHRAVSQRRYFYNETTEMC